MQFCSFCKRIIAGELHIGIIFAGLKSAKKYLKKKKNSRFKAHRGGSDLFKDKNKYGNLYFIKKIL